MDVMTDHNYNRPRASAPDPSTPIDPTGPFGLDDAEIAAAYARTAGRPMGRARFQAFAEELEQAALAKWRGASFLAVPLAHEYARHRVVAHQLRALVGELVVIVDRHFDTADLSGAYEIMNDYDELVGDKAGRA